MAEHSPVQLVPWPHVTLVRVVLGEQQPTSIDSLEKVKAESKKSTSFVVMLPLKRNVIYLPFRNEWIDEWRILLVLNTGQNTEEITFFH